MVVVVMMMMEVTVIKQMDESERNGGKKSFLRCLCFISTRSFESSTYSLILKEIMLDGIWALISVARLVGLDRMKGCLKGNPATNTDKWEVAKEIEEQQTKALCS